MKYLLIDAGNSRLKWALDEDGRLEHGHVVEFRDLDWSEQLREQLANAEAPAAVFICSVANEEDNAKLKTVIDTLWQVPVTFVESPKLGNGVSNAYIEPAALGSDRWAAMIAAFNRAKAAVCVVDCGTAVTLDIIDHKGRHQGGLIVPGLTLMQNALADNTGALARKIDPLLFTGDMELGADTVACIQAGSVRAICGLIERTVQQSNRRLKTSLECYITGGDARKVIPHLNLRVQFEPYLVLQGLALMARGIE